MQFIFYGLILSYAVQDVLNRLDLAAKIKTAVPLIYLLKNKELILYIWLLCDHAVEFLDI